MHHDTLTAAVAGAAVTSPMWVEKMSEFSSYASAAAQVLGVIWLAIQIATTVRDKWLIRFARGHTRA